MKKLVSLSVMLLFSFLGYSQIKVVPTTQIERLGMVGQSNIYVQKEGVDYTFFYKDTDDTEDSKIHKFSFKDIDNDYEGFYKIIMDGFAATPMRDIKLELPFDFVWLHFTRTANKTSMQFMSIDKESGSTGTSMPMSADDVKRLFSKI